jgi:hypothetical protein
MENRNLLIALVGLSAFAAPLSAQSVVSSAETVIPENAELVEFAVLLRTAFSDDREPVLIPVREVPAFASKFGLFAEDERIASEVHADKKDPDEKDRSGSKEKKGEPNAQTDKNDAEQAKKRSMERRLSQLRRPLHEVVLDRGLPEKSPENQAGVSTALPLHIGASAEPLRTPHRYTVCSQHRPLYFEEVRLERCGRNCGCIQPLVSALAFGTNTLLLPYRWASTPPCQIECARGDCPTGCQMPCCEPLHCSFRGAAMETAVLVGMTFLLF